MIRKIFLLLSIYFSFLLNSINAVANAEDTQRKCEFDKTMRVAIFESGPYDEYQKVFFQLYKQLVQDNYITTSLDIKKYFEFDDDKNISEIIKSSKGGCVEFVDNALYNGKWDRALDEQYENSLKERIEKDKDIDLLIVLGSISAERFSDEVLGIPVMVMAGTDPVGMGITKKREFSDKNNFHVVIEPEHMLYELKIFYDTFHFKNLGYVIDENEKYRLGQGLAVLEELAQKLGFNLVPCKGNMMETSTQGAEELFSKCAKELSTKVDAFYILQATGVKKYKLYEQIEPLILNDIPVLSHNGPDDVARGALLSLTDSDQKYEGQFEALVLKRIFHGEPTNRISQYFIRPITVSLNLKTAELMHWRPDFKLLATLDFLYDKINQDESFVDPYTEEDEELSE